MAPLGSVYSHGSGMMSSATTTREIDVSLDTNVIELSYTRSSNNDHQTEEHREIPPADSVSFLPNQQQQTDPTTTSLWITHRGEILELAYCGLFEKSSRCRTFEYVVHLDVFFLVVFVFGT